MKNLIITFFVVCAALAAQEVVAPTPESVGARRGENLGDYNVTNSFELGYRFHDVIGNALKYRSDVNYGNGLRLLGSSLTVNSRDGRGKYFDEIILTTQGLGNDPYQVATLRIRQNKLYEYTLGWRSVDYFNPGLTAGTLGGHLLDTRRQMQDHDFVIFPTGTVRILGGYSRNTQTGAGLSSVQQFDSRGDEFPLFVNVNRVFREYRLGAEVRMSDLKLVVVRGWQRYEERIPSQLTAPLAGANPNDNTTLSSLTRSEPYQGDTPFWRANLIQERKSWYAIGGRFSYAGGRRDFTFDELSSGTDRLGANRARQVLVTGAGRRPLSYGSLTLSLFPSTRWTITNHTSFQQIQMNGDNTYQEINNSIQGRQILRFQYLGIRTVVNTTEADFRAAKWLGFYSGYHYSTRRIQSREAERVGASNDTTAYEQQNHLHAGVFGVRVQPVAPLSINLSGEVGRNDQPFYPISDRNYHVLGGRVQYKRKNFLIGGAARSNYNTNSVSLFVHSARARNYSADASWTPKEWLSFDAGYGKLHLDTATGLAYFAASRLIEGDRSLYISNIHTGTLGIRLSVQKRVDVYLGYNRVQDTGDGRTRIDVATGSSQGASIAAFRAAQTFPLAYETPLARFSVRLHQKLRFNLGYQFYHYNEDFVGLQNYHAHTGFTSLLWSF